MCRLACSTLAFIEGSPASNADVWKRANSHGGGLTTPLNPEADGCPEYKAKGDLTRLRAALGAKP